MTTEDERAEMLRLQERSSHRMRAEMTVRPALKEALETIGFIPPDSVVAAMFKVPEWSVAEQRQAMAAEGHVLRGVLSGIGVAGYEDANVHPRRAARLLALQGPLEHF